MRYEEIEEAVNKVNEYQERRYLKLLTSREKVLLKLLRAMFGEDAIIVPSGVGK